MKDLELERLGALALNVQLGYQPAIAQQIISAFSGNCSDIFKMDAAAKREILGAGSKWATRLDGAALDAAATMLKYLEKRGCRFLPCFDERFPEALRQCEDCPTGLYVRSDSPLEEIFSDEPCIAIVGTRDISPYGMEWCTKIVSALSQAPVKPKIVSGLALGVDIRAHMDALAFSLGTIGVLPTGIDEVYPGSHRVAAEKIASRRGCALVSDFPPGTSPQACTFLRRNRIIAGLSGSTILVESKRKGGGLITARLAFGYSRSVFALPGRIDDVRSEGCNLLLQEGIAAPIADLASLPKLLGLGESNRHRKADLRGEILSHFSSLESTETQSLADAALLIKARRGISTEEIAEALGIGYPQALSLVGELESEGFIEVDLMQRCTINYKKIA